MGRILIVEDQTLLRDSLKVLLSGEGHAIETASNGGEGLAKYRAFRPDLILLDRNLPGTTGSEVLRTIRKTDKEVDVVVMTSYADAASRSKYMALGATDFLSKGDGFDDLLAVVKERLGGSQPAAE